MAYFLGHPVHDKIVIENEKRGKSGKQRNFYTNLRQGDGFTLGMEILNVFTNILSLAITSYALNVTPVVQNAHACNIIYT